MAINESRAGGFKLIFVLVALLHCALLSVLLLVGHIHRKPNEQNLIWVNPGSFASSDGAAESRPSEKPDAAQTNDSSTTEPPPSPELTPLPTEFPSLPQQPVPATRAQVPTPPARPIDTPAIAEKPASSPLAPSPMAPSPLAPSPLMTITPRPTPKPTPKAAKALAHAESALKPLASPRATVTPAKPSAKTHPATKSKPSPSPTPSSDQPESEHPKRIAAKKDKPEQKPSPSPGKNKPIAASANQAKNEHSSHKVAESANGEGSEKTGSSDSEGEKGHGSGAGDAGIGRYAEIIHNRFFAAWNQPQSEMALGAHLVATVKLHIEADGAVTDFAVVEGSGNAVVDQSVREAGKKITRLPPPPNGGPFSPIIRFELGD